MDVKNTNILIVDDDRKYARDLARHLKDIGQVELAYSEDDFRKIFTPYKFDLILLDLRLKEGKEGIGLLEYIVEEDPSTVVIVISGYGDIATAVEALHKGAKTFLEKDKVSFFEIRIRSEHAIKENMAERRIRQLEASQEQSEIIGNDPKIQKIRSLIRLVAQDGEATVLIRGDTGTGKELVARAIHRQGVRKDGPFVIVALTDVNTDTVTSELFGHEKGAFTGADSRHIGYFEQAHRGVLFLDEIGDIPLDIQVKLLRVIEQQSFRRMGGKKDIQVDVQLVTATNRPLERLVKEKKFREDLYYRLKVFEIYLPPLRERKGDIELLARHFLQQLKQKGRTRADGFTEDALDLMQRYRWPGNVRELKAAIESAGLRCRLEGCSIITPKHLMPLLMDHSEAADDTGTDLFKTLARVELEMVAQALERSGGRKTEAWKLLGYQNRFAMLRRVKKILSEYPDVADEFPALKRSYSQREENTRSR